MPELSTVEFGDFVKLARVIWIRGHNSVEQSMVNSGMVRVTDIPTGTGNTREFSEIDTNEYLLTKEESEQASRGKVQQGYTKTMTSKREGENIGISFEMRTQNKYPEVVNRLLGAGRKGANTVDLDLSHRVTFGTATSYTDRVGNTVVTTVGDGFQLFYTAHTVTGSSTTFRNRLANNPALSKGAIEGMERLITEETINHLGEKVTAPFDILFTTDDPNTVNTAREYLQSTADVTGAHPGIVNVYKGKYRHVVLPRVATDANGASDSTKRQYWGIASSLLSSFNLGVWESPHMVAPTANSNAEDVQTDDWEFRVRAGYGIVVVGPTWVKFSTGDGTA